MGLAICPARFSCSCSATRLPSIHGRGVCERALLAGERQRHLAMGDKDPGKVDRPSRPVVKPRARTAQHRAWLCYHCDACLAGDSHRSVRHVDHGGRLACVIELLPVDRTMFAHYASMTLTTIRLHPTRLETWTKESNMYASLWVIETCGRNESKGRPRRLR